MPTPGPSLRIHVEQAELPTPDIVVINHPRRGITMLVDPRVDPDRITDTRALIEARAALHPERLCPECWAPPLIPEPRNHHHTPHPEQPRQQLQQL